MAIKRKRIAIAIAALLAAVVAPVLVSRFGKASLPKETPPLSESEKTQKMLEERAQDPVYMEKLGKIERAQNSVAGERLAAAEEFARWEEAWLGTNEKARLLHEKMVSANDEAQKRRLKEEYEEEVRRDGEGAKLLAAVKSAEAKLEVLRQTAGAVIGERIRRQRPAPGNRAKENFEERRAAGLVKEVKAPPRREARSVRPPHSLNKSFEKSAEEPTAPKEEKL